MAGMPVEPIQRIDSAAAPQSDAPAPSAPISPLLPPSDDDTKTTGDAAASQRADIASPEVDIVVTGRRGHAPGDPLEELNSKSFAVTQSVDDALVEPIALAYEHSLPRPIRSGLRNVLENLHEPVVFLNFLIQLKPGKAAETLGRFAINSTIGGAGLFDIAKRHPFNLPLRRNGFADSLGYYGVKPGPFLFLPLIGPTTVRDLLGGGIDRLALTTYIPAPINRPLYTVPIGVLSELDRRAQLDTALGDVRKAADPYAARRALYLSTRKSEINHLHGRPVVGPVHMRAAQRDSAICDQPPLDGKPCPDNATTSPATNPAAQ